MGTAGKTSAFKSFDDSKTSYMANTSVSRQADDTQSDDTIPDTSIENILSHTCDFQNKSEILPEALRHHFRAGGSRTRATLCFNFSRAFGLTAEQAAYMACVPELLHNASLIHDDLQDTDETRRGHASLWKKFGRDIAICAGDFLISAAYKCAAETKTERLSSLIEATHNHVNDVVKGQIDDLSQDKHQTLADVSTYEQICARKSGALLAMCLTLPLIARTDTGNRTQTVPVAKSIFEHYATAYQICDDLHDIAADQAKKGQQAAVNIYTVLQQQGNPSPFDAATELAFSHIQKAESLVVQLPEPAQDVLHRELANISGRVHRIKKAQQ